MSIDPTDNQAIDRAVAELRDSCRVGDDGRASCPLNMWNSKDRSIYSPATNIAQAWELVDEMGDNFYALERGDWRKGCWRCQVMLHLDMPLEAATHSPAPTPQAAISLAYIQFKESQK